MQFFFTEAIASGASVEATPLSLLTIFQLYMRLFDDKTDNL